MKKWNGSGTAASSLLTAAALASTLVAPGYASVFSVDTNYKGIGSGYQSKKLAEEVRKLEKALAKKTVKGKPSRKPAQAVGPFDVNDLSILFPVDENKNPIPEIRITDLNINENPDDRSAPFKKGLPLLSQVAFDDIVATAKDATPVVAEDQGTSMAVRFQGGSDKRESWRVYGFRYDPCAPTIELDPAEPAGEARNLFEKIATVTKNPALKECIQQIRLVVSPDSVGGNRGNGAQDFAMHLVYVVGQGSVNGIDAKTGKPKNPLENGVISSLLKIKELSKAFGFNTDGRPLGVHEGMRPIPAEKLDAARAMAEAAFPGLGKKIVAPADALKALILNAVAESTLVGVAFMGLQGGIEPWVFMSGMMTANDAGQSGFQPPVKDRHWKVLPRGNGFGPSLLSAAELEDPAKVQAAFGKGTTKIKVSFIDSARVIPQPLNRAESTAPAFMNTSSALADADKNAVYRVDNPRIANLANRDCISCHSGSTRIVGRAIKPTADAFFPAKGVTGFIERKDLADRNYNVRNFGYFHNKPSINFRALNETSEVVEYLNRKLGFEQGPGYTCDKSGSMGIAFECVLGGFSSIPQKKGFDECMKLAECTSPTLADGIGAVPAPAPAAAAEPSAPREPGPITTPR